MRFRILAAAVGAAFVGALALQVPAFAKSDPFSVEFQQPYRPSVTYVDVTFVLRNNTPSRISVTPQRPGGREGRQLVLYPKGQRGDTATDNIHLPCAQKSVTVNFKYDIDGGRSGTLTERVDMPACRGASGAPAASKSSAPKSDTGSGGGIGILGQLKLIGFGLVGIVVVLGWLIIRSDIRKRRQ